MTAPQDDSATPHEWTATLACLADAAYASNVHVGLGFYEAAGACAARLPMARFRPAASICRADRAGRQRDLQVEAAVALGLFRWQPDDEPRPAPGWLLRRTPAGLALIAPRSLVFSRGQRHLPAPWRTAALTSRSVLVQFGRDIVAAGVIPYLDAV
ncbi:hypothetical protein OWR29_37545 [Actinoplanes sp. Pm04-4]|uniref:Uncharacterized protein n=1 Tax=Paractinoplanes pyxinae TaxID=2997416 RepID=A0ABT4BD32_9ACTN|nr:hypothetical protein [Actinoplanes pyxinae]MCY1143740.1 hypothetical protein [Actinoplanes pyxinae]